MCENYLAYKPLNYPVGHICHLRSLNLPREGIFHPITHAISNKYTVCIPIIRLLISHMREQPFLCLKIFIYKRGITNSQQQFLYTQIIFSVIGRVRKRNIIVRRRYTNSQTSILVNATSNSFHMRKTLCRHT